MEQLELDSPDLSKDPRTRTVVVSDGGGSLPPVVIEVEVEKDGPVSLELLTKFLIVGIVFLATRHIAPSVAIVGAILSAFLPDVITDMVRRRRWGKKRVGLFAGLAIFFSTLDSTFAKSVGRLVPDAMRRLLRPARRGAQKTLGAGHAAATTAVAVAACAIAIAVPAVASGASPFATSSAPTAPAPPTKPAPAPAAHTPATHAPANPGHAPAAPPAQPQSTTQPTGTAQTSQDLFVQVGISPDGVPGSVTVTPGQRAHLQFTLDQTSKVVFAIREGSTLANFHISRDNGQDGSSSIAVDQSHPYTPADLTAGTHSITIAPDGNSAGTLHFVLYASTDLTQAADVSAQGVPGSVTLTPGQRAHLQFTVDQTSKVVFAVNDGSTLASFHISRDNGQDESSSIAIDSSNPYIPADLAAGTHSITIEPDGASGGVLRFTLYASADLIQFVRVSSDGARGLASVTPGQRVHIAFNLEQPSQIMLAVSDNSTVSAFHIWHDDGQDESSSIAIDSSNPYAPATILAAGTHTITIEPDGTSAGALVYTLAVHPD